MTHRIPHLQGHARAMSILTLPPSIEALGAVQSGLVTRAQLEDAGISSKMVRRRLVSQWLLPLPGVVQLGRGPLDEQQKLVAAALLAGPDAVVTGPAAARWHGLTNAADPMIDVLVPSHLASRTVGFVRIRRTSRPTRFTTGSGLVRIAPAPRAVADACRRMRVPRDAEALVIEAVQRRKAKIDELRHELHAGPRRDSAALRTAIEAAATGAWSAPEHDLLALCLTSRCLPEPWPNPELRAGDGSRLPTPDLWFDDVGLAVQVHSAQHHSSPQDWTRTVRDDSRLAEAGILRLAVAPREITSNAPGVLARIESLHGSMRASRRPPVDARRRAPR